MDKYIYDENSGLWYKPQDDCYMPYLQRFGMTPGECQTGADMRTDRFAPNWIDWITFGSSVKFTFCKKGYSPKTPPCRRARSGMGVFFRTARLRSNAGHFQLAICQVK